MPFPQPFGYLHTIATCCLPPIIVYPPFVDVTIPVTAPNLTLANSYNLKLTSELNPLRVYPRRTYVLERWYFTNNDKENKIQE